MTAHVPMARVPFAPLDNPRLQHLASAKNRQNGVFKAAAKPGMMKSTGSVTCHKRAYEASSTFDDDFDAENVDPAMFDSPAKKTKGNAFDAPKPFTFSLSTTATAAKAMPPPATRTPLRANMSSLRANMSSLRAPSTAPAGRSPKRKIAGMKSTRRISAPFGRVDPPSFSSASALPFSLDAALNGTLPSSTPAPKSSEGATIAESMPKNWFFEIYQDSPEEEAANLMEHSTLTLDLSSDDEDVKSANYRGKENTPPEGYDAPTASRSGLASAAVSKKDIVRKKIVVDDMDDGSRSPLSDLETESFIPEGLSKDSCVVVEEIEVVPSAEGVKEDVSETVKEPVSTAENITDSVPAPVEEAKDLFPAPAEPAKEADSKEEIIVWQDEFA